MQGKQTRAYTLIEVLLVVAILAVLAGIGFAVAARAREQVRRTVCVSHLRQFAQAIAMYRQDWEDPLHFLPELPGAFYPHYISDKRVFLCPDDNRPELRVPLPFPWPYLNVSYGWQNTGRGSPDGHIPPFDQLYAKRGEDYPIAYDNWHLEQRDIGLGGPYLVLRLNGRVQWVSPDVSRSSDF